MKICLIAEGSYPYIMGGVSSWIQMLITSMPQHQFIIYAIGAEEKNRGNFKCVIPSNVIEIKETFLDEFTNIEGEWGKNYLLTELDKSALKNLISGGEIDWYSIFDMVRNSSYDNVTNFLMSKDFFKIVELSSEQDYPHIAFTEFYWMVKSMLLSLLQIIQNDLPEADIYHSVSTGYAGVVGSMAKYLYNKPFVLTEHGIYSREREEEIIKSDWLKGYFKDMWINFFYNLSKLAYDSADKVISLFENNKNIEIELGCNRNKIEIIPNGIDINQLKAYKTERTDDFINFGALLRIVPIKDVKTMIHGFYLAKQQVGNIRLYIMGPTDEDNEYYQECLQLVDSLKVSEVIFTGRINPEDYLGKMDCLLLTSISEGQPFAILEAMGYKKPLITTDVGSCRELLEGNSDIYGDAGIVIPVMDYEKLGKAIVKMARNQSLRRLMGESGYSRVKNLYTDKIFIDRYTEVYSELG